MEGNSIHHNDQTGKMGKKIQKILTLVGGVILLIPNGTAWIWGNMSTDCLSYLVIFDVETSNIQSLWVTSFYIVSWILTVTINNYLNKWMTWRWIIILGIIVSDLGPFLSCYAIKGNALLFFATYGLLTGSGTCLLYANALHLVIALADTEVGLYFCVIQSAFSLGAVMLTELVTWYTNPGNLVPEFELEKWFISTKLTSFRECHQCF